MRICNVTVSLAILASGIIADESSHLLFSEYQAIVSQKLVIAQDKNDGKLLQEAETFRKKEKYVNSNGVLQLRYKPEEVFPVRLQAFQVADRMQDKSYDCNVKLKAGIYGNVPWPPDGERPEELRKTPLWMPGTHPEYFKDRDPELYAFYKPLYEENQQNTKKYLLQARIRVIRTDLLDLIKRSLQTECSRGARSLYFSRYLQLIDEIITDKNLRDEILSDIPPERRLPETSPTKQVNQ